MPTLMRGAVRGLGILVVAVLASPLRAQQFIASTPFSGPAVWTNGVAFADVDGDGDQDVLFANGSSYGAGGAQPQHLFLNNGSGGFTAAHSQLNVANFNAQMVIAEDFDQDGDPDLMYAAEGPYPGPTQKPRYLRNNGDGNFTDLSVTLPNVSMASFCVGAGDVDDDGDLDVVFTDGATLLGIPAQAKLYLNDGNAVFSDATATHLPVDLYNAQDVTLLDWDCDGDVDLALSGKGSAGKRSRLYRNDGTGHFTISNLLDNLGTQNTYEIDYATLDGDGDPDVMVQSLSGLSDGWARNDGIAMTTALFPPPNGDDDGEMAGLDYDGDGDIDVFIGSLGASEKVYRNNGDGTFTATTAATIQPVADSTLDLGFADLDRDGDYDMVTAQGEGGNVTDRMYRNGGPMDTLPPALLKSFAPAGVGAAGTVFKVLLRDAVHDDGAVNVATSFDYHVTTNNGAIVSGSANGFHMGGGLFRAQVPTTASSIACCVTWHATDAAGNTTTYAPTSAGSAWIDLGFAKPGTAGLPVLTGTGALSAGASAQLALTHARPTSAAALILGLSAANLPFMGGTLVPMPQVVQILTTDASGAIVLPFAWPAGVPPGLSLYLQYAINDPLAGAGVAMSNACQGVTQCDVAGVTGCSLTVSGIPVVCKDMTTVLEAKGAPPGGGYTWGVIPGGGDAVILGPSANTAVVQGVAAGPFAVQCTYEVDDELCVVTYPMEVVDVSISGPKFVCMEETIVLTAVPSPLGGTYEWSIVTGADKASIVGPANAQSVIIRGDAHSDALDDVTVKLKYVVKGAECDREHKLTVVEVTATTADVARITDVLGDPFIDHFVTPKGTAGGLVTLTAHVAPNHPVVKAMVSWEGATKISVDPPKATTPSGAAARHIVKIKIDGIECRQARVWVVWCDFVSVAAPATSVVGPNLTTIDGGYTFVATIEPPEIITDADRPDFSGANTSAPPDVSAGDTGVLNLGVDLSGGAKTKWDISRQVRQSVAYSPGLVLPDPPYEAKFYADFLNYPSDDVCGNDDQSTADRINDPYPPGDGTLLSVDKPGRLLFHVDGALGATADIHDHFREFIRLEIEGVWTRVSDFYSWKIHFRFRKEAEALSGVDYNGDGDLLDTVWIDNGSFIALNNDGF